MARKKSLESIMAIYKKSVIKTPTLKAKRGGYKLPHTPAFKPYKFK